MGMMVVLVWIISVGLEVHVIARIEEEGSLCR